MIGAIIALLVCSIHSIILASKAFSINGTSAACTFALNAHIIFQVKRIAPAFRASIITRAYLAITLARLTLKAAIQIVRVYALATRAIG
jgi:hypothetical protein